MCEGSAPHIVECVSSAPDPSATAPRRWWRAARAFPRDHPWAWDLLTAALFWLILAFFVLLSLLTGPREGNESLVPVLVVSSLHTAGVALRRRRPVTAFWLVVAGCVVQLVASDNLFPTDAAVLVVAYALTRYSDDVRMRRVGLAVCAVSGFLAVVDWNTFEPGGFTATATGGAFLSAFVITFWIWGDLNRKRQDLVAGLEQQNLALRRDRDQRVALATQAERARIAREMHDIVAHSLSVVVVQSDGAAYAAEHGSSWDRDQAAHALKTIGETARSALAETRRLVGVLRQEGDAEDYAPTSSLAQLDELIDGTRQAGLTVELDERGDRRALPREGDLAAYRIVQESLTNVLRHAGPGAAARVTVDYGEPVRIEVRDNGSGAGSGDGQGNGLIGMRERIHQVGGRFVAGPAPGGGWRVQALIPTGTTGEQ